MARWLGGSNARAMEQVQNMVSGLDNEARQLFINNFVNATRMGHPPAGLSQ